MERQALVVAGLSDVGKTTFIDALRRGQCDQDILAALPHGCSGWASARLRNLCAQDTLPTEPVVVEYDATYPYRLGINDFQDHNFFQRIWSFDVVTLVMLQADPHTLRQRTEQERAKRISRRAPIVRAYRERVIRPWRRLATRLRLVPAPEQIDIYGDPDWLRAYQAKLDCAIAEQLVSRERGELVVVTSAAGPDGRPAFKRAA